MTTSGVNKFFFYDAYKRQEKERLPLATCYYSLITSNVCNIKNKL